jgi:hypothetical protein
MKKLSWNEYLERLMSVKIQFNFARNAIDKFKTTPEALDKFAKEEYQGVIEIIEENISRTKMKRQEIDLLNPRGAAYLDSVKNSVPDRLVDVENRLNQNELILSISILETFMKDVHREILRQQPSLLKADRDVKLGKIISIKIEQVIEEEIDREVQALDRKNVKEKAKYFKDKLKVDWTFDGTIIPLMESVIEKRNEILHGNPNAEIDEIDKASSSMACMGIPFMAVVHASALYPDGFEKIEKTEKLTTEIKKNLKLKSDEKDRNDI